MSAAAEKKTDFKGPLKFLVFNKSVIKSFFDL